SDRAGPRSGQRPTASWSRGSRAGDRWRGGRPPRPPRSAPGVLAPTLWPSRSPWTLRSTDRQDLHFHGARGHGDFHCLTRAVTLERAPDRRLVADLPLLRRCLSRSDDRVLLFASVGLDRNVAPDLDEIVLLVLVDDLSVLDHLLEGHDPALEEGLVVLRLLQLGVLGEIAELHGRVDPLGHLGALGRSQLFKLRLQLLEPIGRDVYRLFEIVH